MKRSRSLKIACVFLLVVVADYLTKPACGVALCSDGSQLEGLYTPFMVSTSRDDHRSFRRSRTYLGAFGTYKIISQTKHPISFNGTRMCFVPAINKIAGANIVAGIYGNEPHYVGVTGSLQSRADLPDLAAIVKSHPWYGPTDVWWDVTFEDSSDSELGWEYGILNPGM